MPNRDDCNMSSDTHGQGLLNACGWVCTIIGSEASAWMMITCFSPRSVKCGHGFWCMCESVHQICTKAGQAAIVVFMQRYASS
jgi:hypothetical protein